MLGALARLLPELFSAWIVQDHPPLCHQLKRAALGLEDNSETLLVQTVIWHDICFHAYTSAKDGTFDGRNWLALFTARRRVYSRYAPVIHSMMAPRSQVANTAADDELS